MVVKILPSTLFTGFSIDLPNIALIFNLAFCFLILLPSFSASLHKLVLRLIYGFKKDFCLNSNIP